MKRKIVLGFLFFAFAAVCSAQTTEKKSETVIKEFWNFALQGNFKETTKLTVNYSKFFKENPPADLKDCENVKTFAKQKHVETTMNAWKIWQEKIKLIELWNKEFPFKTEKAFFVALAEDSLGMKRKIYITLAKQKNEWKIFWIEIGRSKINVPDPIFRLISD